jgi:hypothetical protein
MFSGASFPATFRAMTTSTKNTHSLELLMVLPHYLSPLYMIPAYLPSVSQKLIYKCIYLKYVNIFSSTWLKMIQCDCCIMKVLELDCPSQKTLWHGKDMDMYPNCYKKSTLFAHYKIHVSY